MCLITQGALQRLRAIDCQTIRRLAIQLPPGSLLRDVNLSLCPNMSAASISANRLQNINLQQCASLTELHLSCDHLRY